VKERERAYVRTIATPLMTRAALPWQRRSLGVELEAHAVVVFANRPDYPCSRLLLTFGSADMKLRWNPILEHGT
jgi:hypothetical protein